MCATRPRLQSKQLIMKLCHLAGAGDRNLERIVSTRKHQQRRQNKDPGSLSVLHPSDFELIHVRSMDTTVYTKGTWHDALNDATATNAMTLEYMQHNKKISARLFRPPT